MIYTDSEFLNSIALFFYNHLPDVLNLNLTASIVILFVICVRQFLKRAPKIFSYALWGIVLLRLLVPVSIESPMSFVPERTEFTSMVDVNEALPEIEFQTAEDRLDNKRQMEISPTGDPMVLSHSIVEPQHYLTMIWIAGILFLSVRSLLAYLGLRERVKVSVPLQKGVYIADDIDTPFVIGISDRKSIFPAHWIQRNRNISSPMNGIISEGEIIFSRRWDSLLLPFIGSIPLSGSLFFCLGVIWR